MVIAWTSQCLAVNVPRSKLCRRRYPLALVGQKETRYASADEGHREGFELIAEGVLWRWVACKSRSFVNVSRGGRPGLRCSRGAN